MAYYGLFRHFVPRKVISECSPERNLAYAVIRQAWNEAVMNLDHTGNGSKKDCGTLKQKAIDWFFSNDGGLVYWCQLADMDHIEVRLKLDKILRAQRPCGDQGAMAPRP